MSTSLPNQASPRTLGQIKTRRLVSQPTTLNPFTAILAQAPQPYVAFTAAQSAAYSFICQKLNVAGGIRTLYGTAVPTVLTELQINLNHLHRTSGDGFSAADFAFVVDTLGAELTAAANVAGFFQNFTQVYNQCFSLGLLSDTQMINDVGLADTPSAPISGFIANIVEGVATSLINLIPVVGGMVAGLVQTTISAVEQGVALSGPQPPNALNVTVSELFDQLSTSFHQLSNNIVDIQTRIVRDWGMLNATSELMSNSGVSSPLFWSPQLTQQVESAAQIGYQLAALQLLLPVNYCIYSAFTDGKGNLAYLAGSNHAYWPATLQLGANTPTLLVPTASFGPPYLYRISWIAKKTDVNAFLDSADIHTLLDQNPLAFGGLAGWSLINTSYGWTDALTVRVSNNSPLPLTVTNATWSGGGLGLYSPNSTVIPANAVAEWVGCTQGLSTGSAILSLNFATPAPFSETIAFQVELDPASVFSAGDTNVLVHAESFNYFEVVATTNDATNAGSHGGGALLCISPNYDKYPDFYQLPAAPPAAAAARTTDA